ncbi:MAG: EamA family transporter [Phycisphaerae bacterium]
MLLLGIITGLLAAFCQSLCYMATRYFVQRRPAGANRTLLVLANIEMGLVSLALLPFFWPHIVVDWHVFLEPTLLALGTYIVGQAALLVALRYAEPSKVSPLLGLKLIVLAGLSSTLYPGSLTGLQWSAVVVCVAGALALYHAGGRWHPLALSAVVVACLFYSFSDWNIKRMINALPEGHSLAWRSMFAMLVCYSLSGIVAVPFLWLWGSRRYREWRGVMSYVASWYTAMWLLFACFAFVGPVYGNILQSTRGLISILLAAAAGHVWKGAHHIEVPTGRGELFRRLAAGTLMFSAVALYALKNWPW